MRHTAAKLVAAVAVTAATVALAAVPAQADPGVTPNAVDLVGTGSDTTSTYLAQISADYNASIVGQPASTPRLYSWDPTGSATITPKTGAATIARPNGSSAGVTALNNNTSTTVDFARSSRGPQTGDTTDDLFVAFAKDAVTWSAKNGGHAPANLTTAQLKGIYECTVTNWSTVGGTAGTIKPFLPQNGSGTRTFFLKAIGGATPVTPGACVTSGPQENTGTTPALDDVDAIFPYSVAHNISQVYGGHGTPTDNPGNLTLRNINGVAPVNAAHTINAPFAASAYGRVVYNVVRAAAWNTPGTYSTALKNVFSSTGWICTHPATITNYGFLALPGAACGTTTTI
ncbi:ABC-type phosphate transport system substrate-binding protein [Kitasatospora gansuensis]|uniref:ABC-type phosphate transport system substrate-binding protein n=1 Tax=Kitasatospora gansuensis TaxID=258050 RepID=A0A7W7WG23_9ACTN|nr:substrate-binding domain-containing protein [Kitasatospora gansuensis]MBB4944999.1 ABC-type phosphate transport system substrate-binding protein [Kitasatospora gansuensis]